MAVAGRPAAAGAPRLLLLWRWWPRAPAPGLLWVLFIGFAWLPLALGLYAAQSALYALTGEFLLDARRRTHCSSVSSAACWWRW